jgi:hypothetical protein
MAFGPAILVGGYLIVCALVGMCGRRTRLGFVMSALFSLVLTPVIMLFLIHVFGPRRDAPPAT